MRCRGSHLSRRASVLQNGKQRVNRRRADAPQDSRGSIAIGLAIGAQNLDQGWDTLYADASQGFGSVISNNRVIVSQCPCEWTNCLIERTFRRDARKHLSRAGPHAPIRARKRIEQHSRCAWIAHSPERFGRGETHSRVTIIQERRERDKRPAVLQSAKRKRRF